jgi:hypothetical protein
MTHAATTLTCPAMPREVADFGQVLTQQAVGVLAGTAWPGASRIAEVDLHASLLGCRMPRDHVPTRSGPLFKARDLMRDVIESLRQDSAT